MIKIKEVTPDQADLYSPDGKKIGTVVGELQFYDVRQQIQEKKLEGYYFLHNNEKIIINPDGSINNWPNGFFDKPATMLAKIIRGYSKK